MAERLKRSEVPVEQTWNLDDLFPSQEAWEAELDEVRDAIGEVTQYQGRLGEGAGVLLACLVAREAFENRAMRLGAYASLKEAADGTDPENQANAGRCWGLFAEIQAALSFVDSEILELPNDTVDAYLMEDPGLAVWKKPLLDLLETKPHRLSGETEEVLAAFSEVLQAPSMIYERTKASDMAFAPVAGQNGEALPMSFALYEDRYELSPDTEVRRRAFQSFVNTLNQYKNAFAATYGTEVKKQVTEARVRKYESVTDMLLQPQQVTLEMYHNIHDIILTELAPHMRRLAKLKQRVLGLDKMLHCDLKVPLDPNFSPATSYEEASATILDAVSVMGQEYVDIMREGLTKRWVDLADNVGKSTGAFCGGHYDVHPYILITWTDTMRGTFVLAHELGHAGHFVLAGRNQRPAQTWPSMYFSEAPSTMNERLLAQHILKNSSDVRMRRWVIGQSLNTYYHNFVTHLLEAELQRRVYKLADSGQPLTAKLLCEQKGDVLGTFWGDAVEIDDGARLTWMRQPHYYAGLYPYSYSAGLTISTAAAELIEQEGQPAVDRWLSALKAGGSLRPLELTQLAGVDMSTPDPIRRAVAYVGSLVDELEASF